MRWARAPVARAAVAMVATSWAATPRPTATQEAAATKEAATKPTLTAISATLTTTVTVGMAHTTAAIRPNPGLDPHLQVTLRQPRNRSPNRNADCAARPQILN